MTSQQQPVTTLLIRVWQHISKRRRVQFALLLVLMLLVSFAEILSIGSVLPFLGVLTDPNRIFAHPSAQPIIQTLSLTEPKQLIFPFTVIFGFAALIAGAMRLLLLWAGTRLSHAAGADISIDIYRRTLYQPYSVHVARNSSEIIDGIAGKTNTTVFLINMTLNLISSVGMLFAILLALLLIEPIIALSAIGGFGLIYFIIISLTRKRVLVNSQVVARESIQLIKSLQEGLGGIRDVLIDGSQPTFCQIYAKADQPMRRAQGNNQFINSAPKYAIEALCMVLIAGLAFMLVRQDEGITMAIPVLGSLALGAQRILPILQQAYSSWSSIQGGQASLKDILELLEQPLPEYAERSTVEQMSFNRQIKLNQVSFRYSTQTPWVVKNLSLSIPKGSCVGFVGVTGSGKSTLLDIVMGLLQPSDGSLVIDNETVTLANNSAWQAHIAHVPQTIYLVDATIEENIAFGIPKAQIDSRLVRQAAQKARIAEIVESWPNRYQTLVGERGVRLSGGQRQRIGIARALYKQVDVIIFDEATSSLDNDTEREVIDAIEELHENLTILMIAHRTTTLKNCTQIVELGDGEIKRIGTYQELFPH
jgi:ABC-type bacteriocin/lantibiotic exporter with double-glycine peptidase domain